MKSRLCKFISERGLLGGGDGVASAKSILYMEVLKMAKCGGKKKSSKGKGSKKGGSKPKFGGQ